MTNGQVVDVQTLKLGLDTRSLLAIVAAPIVTVALVVGTYTSMRKDVDQHSADIIRIESAQKDTRYEFLGAVKDIRDILVELLKEGKKQ